MELAGYLASGLSYARAVESKMRFPRISKAVGTYQMAYGMVRNLISQMRPHGLRTQTSQLKAQGSRLNGKMGSKQSRHGRKADGQAKRQAGLQARKQACRQAHQASKSMSGHPKTPSGAI